MKKFTYFAKNFPETVLSRRNPVYRYYIPSIDEHIWVCRDCRLQYWESILLKKWRLVDRKPEGEQPCMACSAEESEAPAAGHCRDEIATMLKEDLLRFFDHAPQPGATTHFQAGMRQPGDSLKPLA